MRFILLEIICIAFIQIRQIVGTYPRTKDGFLEIPFYDGNQVDDKIVCKLGEGFLCIYSNFV